MQFKLAVVVVCVFISSISRSDTSEEDDLSTKNRDIWKTLTQPTVFWLLRRTFRVGGQRSKCVYATLLRKNKLYENFEQIMGSYNESQGKYTARKVYVALRKGRTGHRNHMEISFKGYDNPRIEFKLIYDDNNGCIILRVTKDWRNETRSLVNECEMWATGREAKLVNSVRACEIVYQNRCKPDISVKEDTPYVTSCEPPPTTL